MNHEDSEQYRLLNRESQIAELAEKVWRGASMVSAGICIASVVATVGGLIGVVGFSALGLTSLINAAVGAACVGPFGAVGFRQLGLACERKADDAMTRSLDAYDAQREIRDRNRQLDPETPGPQNRLSHDPAPAPTRRNDVPDQALSHGFNTESRLQQPALSSSSGLTPGALKMGGLGG